MHDLTDPGENLTGETVGNGRETTRHREESSHKSFLSQYILESWKYLSSVLLDSQIEPGFVFL